MKRFSEHSEKVSPVQGFTSIHAAHLAHLLESPTTGNVVMTSEVTRSCLWSKTEFTKRYRSYLDEPDEDPAHALEVDPLVAVEHKNLRTIASLIGGTVCEMGIGEASDQIRTRH